MSASRLEPGYTMKSKVKKPEKILRGIYEEIEEGRENGDGIGFVDNHSSCSCSCFAGEEKAAIVQHNGIPAAAEEISALQIVLSGSCCSQNCCRCAITRWILLRPKGIASARFGVADDGS